MDVHNSPASMEGGSQHPFLLEIEQTLQRLRDEGVTTLSPNQLKESQVVDLLSNLPRLTEDELSLGHKDSACPICLSPFLVILAEEEVAFAMDSPAHPIEDLGVTRLSKAWQCGHIFCRRDISKWILEAHDTCPMCRHPLVQRDTDADTNLDLLHVELQQLRDRVQNLSSSLYDLPMNQQFPIPSDSENEFSGMYS